jgi:hypothetical protein
VPVVQVPDCSLDSASWPAAATARPAAPG